MTPRLKSEERCQAIRQAMRKVFAEKGFEGTTTRELAKAAGVSEALLYRHFPSKQAMYAAMVETCIGDAAMEQFQQILSLEGSSSTLVLLIHFLIRRMVFEADREKKATDILVVRSLLEDGEFERVLLKKRASAWHDKIQESLAAAQKAGDTSWNVPVDEFSSWLGKALGFGMSLFLMPEKPVIETKLSRQEMTERTMWFILMGLGLKPEVIKKHYNPKGLALVAAS